MSRGKLGLVLVTGLLATSMLTLLAQEPPGARPVSRISSDIQADMIHRANEQFYGALNSMLKGDMNAMSEVW